MTGFEKDCLEAHNKYRAKHGVPPLKWNAQLKADAQTWANHLADISKYIPTLSSGHLGDTDKSPWHLFFCSNLCPPGELHYIAKVGGFHITSLKFKLENY